jgi:tripartite ATP-independent transporter DctP family solute receptor
MFFPHWIQSPWKSRFLLTISYKKIDNSTRLNNNRSYRYLIPIFKGERMLKKMIGITLLIAVILSPIYSGGKQEATGGEKQIVLRLGHDQSNGHPYDLGVKRFAEEVEKRTNGAVAIKIYPSAQLGDSPEQIEGLHLGTLDLSLAAFSHVAGFVKELDLFGAPFLFENEEHFSAVFNGEVGEILDRACQEKYDIRLLSTFTSGYRLLFNSKRPIKSINDLKGLKIRVMGGESNSLTWSVFGAIPTPLPYSEVYSALQAGVVDGAENEPVSIMMNKFYEAAPYFALTDHLVLPMGLFMSGKVMQDLQAEYQEIIKEAAQNAAIWERDYITEKNMSSIKEMEEKFGVVVTRPDKTVLMERGRPIQDQMAKKLGLEDLLEKVRAAAQ